MSKWQPRGPIAALAGTEDTEHSACMHTTMVGNVAVVTINGPLDTRGGDASYEEIYKALSDARGADAIVLDLDSPGGSAAGMVECARACRALPLPAVVAVANYYACSAAYAIACIADVIAAPPSATVGSIGVRGGHVSWARANDMQGYDVRNVSSGALKLDGDPTSPIDEDALAREASTVNNLAEDFFAWVQERRGFDPRALEGSAVLGKDAVALKLTDKIATLGQVLGELISLRKGK